MRFILKERRRFLQSGRVKMIASRETVPSLSRKEKPWLSSMLPASIPSASHVDSSGIIVSVLTAVIANAITASPCSVNPKPMTTAGNRNYLNPASTRRLVTADVTVSSRFGRVRSGR